jgi:hypothetical protein
VLLRIAAASAFLSIPWRMHVGDDPSRKPCPEIDHASAIMPVTNRIPFCKILMILPGKTHGSFKTDDGCAILEISFPN